MTTTIPHIFETSDGTRLAWHEVAPLAGTGRPLLLIHGLFSTAHVNWVRFGTAAALAAAGFHCHMLDLRGHGQSEAPSDLAKWPPNILARDAADWVRHLGVGDYDLAGFSLGARTSVLGVIGGLTPRRLAICGMGLDGIAAQQSGTDWFINAVENRDDHARGTDEYFAVQFMKTNGVNPHAALHLLRAQVDGDEGDIAAIDIPTLVLCAAEDRFFMDAKKLAALMPNARFATMPGTHMSCVSKPELGEELTAFLTAGS
ncbi:alpha/beta hydrolase [Pacificimonas sp. WHA3]|uniref:Alpha/beta hydrolase n=1 Tax=Pacificimonas pallii TaxID=2827236 RepID=A0ABS6SAS0_9SPHN|nr:alpha/beta hydrolase [Pacificimonas pallii]MBV7255502.1 alpha/beta hydrolase [Pacificimonas pallii]